MCIQPTASLVEHTPAKTEISNPQDDSSTLAFSQATFPWYGETVTADLYFGSNGFITLNQSDSTYSAGSKGGQDEGISVEVSTRGLLVAQKCVLRVLSALCPGLWTRYNLALDSCAILAPVS